MHSIIHKQFYLLNVFRYYTAFRIELGIIEIVIILQGPTYKKTSRRGILDLNIGLLIAHVHVALDHSTDLKQITFGCKVDTWKDKHNRFWKRILQSVKTLTFPH